MYECNAYIQIHMYIDVSIHIRKDTFLLTYQKCTPEISKNRYPKMMEFTGVVHRYISLLNIAI